MSLLQLCDQSVLTPVIKVSHHSLFVKFHDILYLFVPLHCYNPRTDSMAAQEDDLTVHPGMPAWSVRRIDCSGMTQGVPGICSVAATSRAV